MFCGLVKLEAGMQRPLETAHFSWLQLAINGAAVLAQVSMVPRFNCWFQSITGAVTIQIEFVRKRRAKKAGRLGLRRPAIDKSIYVRWLIYLSQMSQCDDGATPSGPSHLVRCQATAVRRGSGLHPDHYSGRTAPYHRRCRPFRHKT